MAVELNQYTELLRKRQFWIVLVVLLLTLVVYRETARSLVDIWIRKDTFAHGFIIIPIVIWLIWRLRERLTTIEVAVWRPGFLLIFALSFVWLSANVAGVLVVEQLAFISLFPAIVLTLFGTKFFRELIFPMSFLYFAVPMGEELVPYLIDYTANFTVAAIKFTGIPVYREGNYFELPTGRWSVVEACSGIRYLIASVTLGVLFSYLNYQSYKKRIIFVIISIIVPIIANWLRAYGIVMIGHFSDMRLATGVDHLIYGWLFFSILIALLFYIGSRWRDDFVIEPANNSGNAGIQTLALANFSPTIFASTLATFAVLPLLEPVLFPTAEFQQTTQIAANDLGSWRLSEKMLSEWKPLYAEPDREMMRTFEENGATVQVYVAQYVSQSQGRELVSSGNLFIDEHDQVNKLVNSTPVTLRNDNESFVANHSYIITNNARLSVYYWYLIGEHETVNRYEAKFRSALAKLTHADVPQSLVTIAIEQTTDTDQTMTTAEQFINQAYSQLKRLINTQ